MNARVMCERNQGVRFAARLIFAATLFLVSAAMTEAAGNREGWSGPGQRPVAESPAIEAQINEEAKAPEQSETILVTPASEADPLHIASVPRTAPVYEGYSGNAGMPDPLFYPLGWRAVPR